MKIARCLAAVAVITMFVSVCAGCAEETSETTTLTPLIEPPIIAEEGVLKVGVDLDYPPFAGVDDGVKAGIDVDIAAAISERLGLQLELVDVKQSEITTALSDGTVDIMLGATPITEAVLADVSTAGSYLVDGPVLYTVVESGSVTPTLSPEALAGLRVAAQDASESYWLIEAGYGEGFVQPYSTLRGAVEALVAGEADVVVGDAAVCAYIARDYENVEYVGQFTSAEPIGIAVAKDAVELEAQVRSILDALAAEGVLGTIKMKWLGDFPALDVGDS